MDLGQKLSKYFSKDWKRERHRVSQTARRGRAGGRGPGGPAAGPRPRSRRGVCRAQGSQPCGCRCNALQCSGHLPRSTDLSCGLGLGLKRCRWCSPLSTSRGQPPPPRSQHRFLSTLPAPGKRQARGPLRGLPQGAVLRGKRKAYQVKSLAGSLARSRKGDHLSGCGIAVAWGAEAQPFFLINQHVKTRAETRVFRTQVFYALGWGFPGVCWRVCGFLCKRGLLLLWSARPAAGAPSGWERAPGWHTCRASF